MGTNLNDIEEFMNEWKQRREERSHRRHSDRTGASCTRDSSNRGRQIIDEANRIHISSDRAKERKIRREKLQKEGEECLRLLAEVMRRKDDLVAENPKRK